MNGMKIGLLPLYLELYDDLFPEMRRRLDTFLKRIEDLLTENHIEVQTAPICRLEHEIKESVEQFENNHADAIVTLHLSYSPSLEAVETLVKTELPVILMDTTPSFSYGAGQDPGELMYNHGIHGVQDLCNLLLRRGKPYLVHAGHWEDPNLIKRIVSSVRAAKMACAVRRSKIGMIGEPFPGMGDFAVPPETLKERLSAEVVPLTPREFTIHGIGESEVAAELDNILKIIDAGDVNEEILKKTVKTDIALRNWFAEKELTGFTFNFRDITRDNGFPTVPFFTAGRAMSEGMGYAGEGDSLTATLIGALMTVYPETSFTEMFCPDWENGTIFLSHMGEVNYTLLSEAPRFKEMNYSFSETGNPAFIPGRFKGGRIVLTNLAPVKGGFRLITAPAEMIDVNGEDRMADSVHGWFQPKRSLPGFLEAYSELGGTHHLAVSYDAGPDILRTFAYLMDWEYFAIE